MWKTSRENKRKEIEIKREKADESLSAIFISILM